MPPWQNWDENSLKRLIRSVLFTERSGRVSPAGEGLADNLTQIWYPFENAYAGTIPANGIIEISDFDDIPQTSGGEYTATIPGTTYGKRYAINSDDPVAEGGTGFCRFTGPCTQAYDSGTPAINEGRGVKPNQFTLAKGYPCTTIVDGIEDATEKLLFGSFDQPSVALIRFTGSVSNNTSTTSYKIYAGTMGSESDAGFTTVPSARNRTGARVNNDWGLLVRVNDGWEIVNLKGSTGGGVTLYWSTLTADLSSDSATATIDDMISLVDGDVVTAPACDNNLGITGVSGDVVLVALDDSGFWPNGYTLVNILHKTRDVVVDIARSGLTVNESRRSITFLEGNGTAHDTAVLTFELSTFVADVFQSGTNFYQTKCTVIGLDDGTEPPCATTLWATGTECTDTPATTLLAAPQMDTDLGLYSAGGQADPTRTYYYKG